ncbi:MAG: O-antigen ligase family protein [Patescibacteria group bacterium]
MSYLDKYFSNSIKFFLFLTALTPLIITKGVIFPYIVGKMIFFRGSIEIAVILFASFITYSIYFKRDFSFITNIKNSFGFLKNPLFTALVLFFISLLISTIFSLNNYRAFWGDLERGEGFLGMLHFFVFLILTLLFFDKKDWLRFFKISLIAGFILAFYASLQYLGVVKFPFALEPMERPDSFIGNSAFLATHMFFLIMFAVIVFYNSLFIIRNSIFKKFWCYFSVLMIIFSASTIFITGTRGAILGLAIGIISLLVYFLIFGQKEFSEIKLPLKLNLRKLSLILMTLIFSSSVIFWLTKTNDFWQSVPGFDRLAKTAASDINDPSTQMRLLAWKASFEAFKEKPLLGWGPENYIFAYAKHYDPAYAVYGETWFDRAHNKILDILVMQGIFGLLSYLAIFGAIFYVIFKKITQEKLVFTFIAAAILAYFIQNLVLFDQIVSYSTFFSVIGFLIFSSTRLSEENINQAMALKKNYAELYLKLRLIIILPLLAFIVLLVYSLYAYHWVIYNQLQALRYSPGLGRIDLVLAELKKALYPYNFAQLNIRGQGLDTVYLGQYFYNEAYRNNPKFKSLGDLWISAVEEILSREPYADVRMNIREAEMLDQLAFNDSSLYDKVEKILMDALEKAPMRQELYYHLSVNLAKQNRFEEALKYSNYALSLNTNVTRAHFYNALVLAANGKDEEAKKELALAEELNTKYDILLAEDKKSIIMLYNGWGMIEKVAELSVKNIDRVVGFPMERKDYENSLRYYLLKHDAVNSIKIANFLSQQFDDSKEDMEIIIDLVKNENWKIIDNLD